MNTTGPQQFVLNGRWRFDESTDQLSDLSGAVSITLKPVVTRLFGLLVRAPGEVLSRRRLFDEGWRRYGFEVCDNSLSQAICALRAVLDALGTDAPCIKTLPRIGYALLADVRAQQLPLHRPRELTYVGNIDRARDGIQTSLYDREAFSSALDREWHRAKHSDLPLSLLLVAVGEVPVAAAHAATIERVASCISKRIRRAGDLAGRYTSDTFAILLPGTDEQGAIAIGRAVELMVHDAGQGEPIRLAMTHARTTGQEHASARAWIDAAFRTLHVRPDRQGHEPPPVPAIAATALQTAA